VFPYTVNLQKYRGRKFLPFVTPENPPLCAIPYMKNTTGMVKNVPENNLPLDGKICFGKTKSSETDKNPFVVAKPPPFTLNQSHEILTKGLTDYGLI